MNFNAFTSSNTLYPVSMLFDVSILLFIPKATTLYLKMSQGRGEGIL